MFIDRRASNATLRHSDTNATRCRRRRILGIEALLLILAALASVPAKAEPAATDDDADRIVRLSDGAALSPAAFIDELVTRRFIILGERHGETAHQDREAFILRALADRGRYPGVAFEMVRPSQETAIRAYRAEQPEYAMGLGITLDWSRTSWPSWRYYAPVFQAALSAKLDIYGAELDGDPPPSSAPPAEIRASWVKSLDASHCGMADADRLNTLATLQWSRDGAMAEALVRADTADGGVLIAGSAHARRDRSVPWRLKGADVVAVAFLDPTSAGDPVQRERFDYVWYARSAAPDTICPAGK